MSDPLQDVIYVPWLMPFRGASVKVFSTIPDGAWPNLEFRASEIERDIRVVRAPDGTVWAELLLTVGYLTRVKWVPLQEGLDAGKDEFAAALSAFVGSLDDECVAQAGRRTIRGLIASEEDFLAWVAREQEVDAFHDHERNREEIRHLKRRLREHRNRLVALKIVDPQERAIALSLATGFAGRPHELVWAAHAIAAESER